MELDGDKLVRAINHIVRHVARPRIETAGGRIVKLMGDAALVEFPSAGSAVSFAVDLQRTLTGTPQEYDFPERIRCRIGIHAGDVIAAGDDLFGTGAWFFRW